MTASPGNRAWVTQFYVHWKVKANSLLYFTEEIHSHDCLFCYSERMKSYDLKPLLKFNFNCFFLSISSTCCIYSALEGYGLTEASPVTHINPFDGKRKPGSIGLPIPDTECRIVDHICSAKSPSLFDPGESLEDFEPLPELSDANKRVIQELRSGEQTHSGPYL